MYLCSPQGVASLAEFCPVIMAFRIDKCIPCCDESPFLTLKCQVLFLKMLKLNEGEYGHYNDVVQALGIINIIYAGLLIPI